MGCRVAHLNSDEHDARVAAASSLGSISRNPSFRAALLHAGAVPALSALLKTSDGPSYPSAAQAYALHCVSRLMDGRPDVAAAVASSGVIPMLVSSLRASPLDIGSIAASTLILLLNELPDHCTQVMAAGALEPEMLRLKSRSQVVQIEAAILLRKLALDNPEHTAQLVDGGVVAPLLNMLQHGCTETQLQATALLSVIAFDANSCTATLPAIKPLLRLAGSPSASYELRLFALETLSEMAADA